MLWSLVCVCWGGGCGFLKYDPESGLGICIIVVSTTFVIGHIYHSSDRVQVGRKNTLIPAKEDKNAPCIWKAAGRR